MFGALLLPHVLYAGRLLLTASCLATPSLQKHICIPSMQHCANTVAAIKASGSLGYAGKPERKPKKVYSKAAEAAHLDLVVLVIVFDLGQGLTGHCFR